jgi:hypothetical protein
MAFGSAADGLMVGPAIALGVSIPMLAFVLAKVGIAMTLNRR